MIGDQLNIRDYGLYLNGGDKMAIRKHICFL